jgi:hypothetical protein
MVFKWCFRPIAAFHRHFPMLQCDPSKPPFAQGAAFVGWQIGQRPKHQSAALKKRPKYWWTFSLGQCSCALLPDTHWRVAILNQWSGQVQLGCRDQEA